MLREVSTVTSEKRKAQAAIAAKSGGRPQEIDREYVVLLFGKGMKQAAIARRVKCSPSGSSADTCQPRIDRR